MGRIERLRPWSWRLHHTPVIIKAPNQQIQIDTSPTDVEPNDMESIIRLIHEGINAYEKDLPNLRKRSQQEGHVANESRQEIGYWPSAGYLRSVTVVGSQKRGVDFIGKENDPPTRSRIKTGDTSGARRSTSARISGCGASLKRTCSSCGMNPHGLVCYPELERGRKPGVARTRGFDKVAYEDSYL
jgi:hypothetical protein